MHKHFAVEVLSRVLPKKPAQKESKIQWEITGQSSQSVRISLVSPYRKGVATFFSDMVTKWLIPGKLLEPSFYFFTQYEGFAIAELEVALDTKQEVTRAKENLPFLEREILMGTSSFYHAKKILEVKGLTLEEKNSFVQEKISALLHRFPAHFDYDLFEEMQHFLIASGGEFKAVHQSAEMARVVFILYLFRKSLEKKIVKNGERRHLCLKLKKTFLHTSFGLKEVLSVFVGMNFVREHELFEERHFLLAFRRFIPKAYSVPGSYFSFKGDKIGRFYLEIEKENHAPFSLLEIRELEKGLPAEIRGKVEQLVSPVFMPRNEEEVMRNILILSHQLKFMRDIPQMILSFNEQDDRELSFTVILVRIVHENTLPLKELLDASKLGSNFSIDRVKIVGKIRKKVPKEAAVLRVRLPVTPFLREDFSVDLFRARLQLVREMENILGEVRDYNGGMISKQSENFEGLKRELGPLAETHSLLLQNFFHSIFPVQLSTTCDSKLLKILFEMFIEMAEFSRESLDIRTKKAKGCLFACVKLQDVGTREKILDRIEKLDFSSNEMLSVQMHIFDSFYLGLILLSSDKERQKILFDVFCDLQVIQV